MRRKWKEKRKSPRVPFDGAVMLISDDSVLDGRIVNLSAGGMFVELTDPPSIGAELQLVFTLFDEEHSAQGTVRWVRDTPNREGIGVEFDALSADTWSQVSRFVADQPPVEQPTIEQDASSLLRALVIETSPSEESAVVSQLENDFYVIYETVRTEDALKSALATGEWDVLIVGDQTPLTAGRAKEVVDVTGADLPRILVVDGSHDAEVVVESFHTLSRSNLSTMGDLIVSALEQSRSTPAVAPAKPPHRNEPSDFNRQVRAFSWRFLVIESENSMYCMRNSVCIGVRDKRTGVWRDSRMRGLTMKGCVIGRNEVVPLPYPGGYLWFDAGDEMLLSSRVLIIRVPTYDEVADALRMIQESPPPSKPEPSEPGT